MWWKLTESAKDNKGKSVANDPLSNGSNEHKDAAEEEVCSWTEDAIRLGLALLVGWKVGCTTIRSSVPTSTSPAHEIA